MNHAVIGSAEVHSGDPAPDGVYPPAPAFSSRSGKFRPMGVEISEHRLEVMLRQLRHCVGEVRMEEELVRLSHARPDPRRLEAVDVMLELSGAPRWISALWALSLRFCCAFPSGRPPCAFFRWERCLMRSTLRAVPEGPEGQAGGLALRRRSSAGGTDSAAQTLFAARTGGVSHRFLWLSGAIK